MSPPPKDTSSSKPKAVTTNSCNSRQISEEKDRLDKKKRRDFSLSNPSVQSDDIIC